MFELIKDVERFIAQNEPAQRNEDFIHLRMHCCAKLAEASKAMHDFKIANQNLNLSKY